MCTDRDDALTFEETSVECSISNGIEWFKGVLININHAGVGLFNGFLTRYFQESLHLGSSG